MYRKPYRLLFPVTVKCCRGPIRTRCEVCQPHREANLLITNHCRGDLAATNVFLDSSVRLLSFPPRFVYWYPLHIISRSLFPFFPLPSSCINTYPSDSSCNNHLAFLSVLTKTPICLFPFRTRFLHCVAAA